MTTNVTPGATPDATAEMSGDATGVRSSRPELLLRRADAMPGEDVRMEGAHDVRMRLMVGRGDGAPTFAMRHFTVAPSGHTPRHHHPYEHEVYVLRGEGTARYGDDLKAIRSGDVLFIEPDVLHQFVNTGAEPLEFLCFVPVMHDCSGERRETPGS